MVLFFKGMIIGVANLVPGVSGATLALVLKIYQPLLDLLRRLPRALLSLLSLRVRAFNEKIQTGFLISVMSGTVAGIILFTGLIEYLLQSNPFFTFAFFFGLILASTIVLGKSIRQYSWKSFICIVVGVVSSWVISNGDSAQANDSVLYLFLCGVASISAMLIPGLSGSYILILMGNYSLILQAISAIQIKTLLPFCLGVIVGLITAANFIKWVLEKYNALSLSVILGFIIGSLKTLWPWQTQDRFNMEKMTPSEMENHYFFPDFSYTTFIAFSLIILGAITVWLIEQASAFDKQKRVER